MNKLNSLETEIIELIVKLEPENRSIYEEHLPLLRVKEREFSGIGVFSHFEYTRTPEKLFPEKKFSSTDKLIKIDSREADIQDNLLFENGLISMLELVTWNDEWNGEYKNFQLI